MPTPGLPPAGDPPHHHRKCAGAGVGGGAEDVDAAGGNFRHEEDVDSLEGDGVLGRR